MIEKLARTSQSIVGFKVSGKLHHEDFRKDFLPQIAAAAEQGEIGILVQFANDFCRLGPARFGTKSAITRNTHATSSGWPSSVTRNGRNGWRNLPSRSPCWKSGTSARRYRRRLGMAW